MLAPLLNAAWERACSAEAAAFACATADVAGTQSRLLARLLHANRRTAFGHAHHFDRLRTPADFRAAVPPRDADAFAPWLARVAAGEAGVLTREPVLLLEPTGGTTGGEKLIPYTATLRREFQRGVAVWLADLFRRRPAVRRGRAYWSVSPSLGPPRRTAGGVPVGLPDDTAYLSPLERLAAVRLLAVPPAVARLPDLDAVRFATLRHLLAAADLALISVWSPSFLTALLDRVPAWLDRLVVGLPAARADALRAGDYRRLWPRLAAVSCWTDAAAGLSLPAVRRLLPGVEILPKGLIATEGFVSIPLVGQPGAAIAIRSHFVEFEEEGGTVRLAHELDHGGRYRVLLTTGNGLYRYRLGDEVEVTGRLRRCPLVRFRGKVGRVSDLVGEKLAEGHVADVLRSAFAAAGLTPTFALLVPVLGSPPCYRLYTDATSPVLAGLVQAGLEANPYYRHAVAFGQLAPSDVRLTDGRMARAAWERRGLERGQKAGDIKPAALDPWPGWPALLDTSG